MIIKLCTAVSSSGMTLCPLKETIEKEERKMEK